MNAKTLYHYTKADTAKLIISGSQLKWSLAPQVNDIFDVAKDIIYDPSDGDGEIIYHAVCADKELCSTRLGFANAHVLPKRKVLSIVKEAVLNSSLRNITLQTPFLCFSAKNDIQLMWAHYGDGYRGVVLEFSGELTKKAEKVIYSSFELFPSVLGAQRVLKIIKGDEEEGRQLIKDLLITKHQVWNYEEEYRILGRPIMEFASEQEREFCKFNINQLMSIYFGLNAKSKDINEVAAMLKERELNHVQLYRMVRDPGYMNMRSEKIDGL